MQYCRLCGPYQLPERFYVRFCSQAVRCGNYTTGTVWRYFGMDAVIIPLVQCGVTSVWILLLVSMAVQRHRTVPYPGSLFGKGGGGFNKFS